MADFFASGRAIDLIVGLTLLQAIGLAIYHRRYGAGLSPADLLSLLVPGLCLLLALRGALVGSHWTWIAACLLAALAAHIVDLRRRWRSRSRSFTSL